VPTSSQRQEPPGVTVDEVLAVLDRHHNELDELKSRHRSAMVARPLPPAPIREDTEPKLSRDEGRRRLGALRRERFGRSP
jgi:hypothetical protein